MKTKNIIEQLENNTKQVNEAKNKFFEKFEKL